MPCKRKKTKLLTKDETENKNSADKENIDEEQRCILTLFRESEDIHAHDRLVIQMRLEFFNKFDITEFCEDFFDSTRFLLMFEDRNRTEVPFKFIVTFLINLLENRDPESHEKCDFFLRRFFGFILYHHDVLVPIIRFHVVQFLHLLLVELNEERNICEQLYNKVTETLLKRLWDVKSYIRAVAASASSRLQDPNSANCPIVIALMHLTRYDSVPTVRLAAMQALAITTKSLPVILSRCSDTNDSIRKRAYELLAKWTILKPLTISKRLQIIESGLNDTVEAVRIATKNLIVVWFNICDKDPIAFLKRLDVENSDYATKISFNVLLKQLPEEERTTIFDYLVNLMDDQKLIKSEHLSPESSFLWKNLINYAVKNQLSDLERITPSLPHFEVFLRKAFEHPIDTTGLSATEIKEKKLEMLPTLKNLLPITRHLNIFDDFSRARIINFIKWALSSQKVPFHYVEYLVKLLVNLLNPNKSDDQAKSNSSVDMFVEIINELLFGDNVATQNVANPPQIPSPNVDLQDDSLTEEQLTIQIRKKRIELLPIQVKLNELNESIREHMNNVDDVDTYAGQISTLKDLQNQRKCLMEEISNLELQKKKLTEQNQMEIEETQTVATTQPNNTQDDRSPNFMEPGMEDIITKGCMITVSMIQELTSLWELTPSLQTLCYSVIIPSVQHKTLQVRVKAFVALGLCCLLDKKLSVKFHTLFIQGLNIDHDSVKTICIKSLVDMFLRFGIEPFQEDLLERKKQAAEEAVKMKASESINMLDDGDSATTMDDSLSSLKIETTHNPTSVKELTDEDFNKCTMELLTPLIYLLNSDLRELQTMVAIGLSKLIYNQKLMSAKLLSRLLLLWFNPSTSDNILLRTNLAQMFSNFSLVSMDNQLALVECFLPTIRTLFKASAESPLASVQINNVIDFFVSVTDSKILLDNRVTSVVQNKTVLTHHERADKENVCHDTLALVLLRQISRSPLSAEVKAYLTTLTKLRLSSERIATLNEIEGALNLIYMRLTRDKRITQGLDKFRTSVKAAIDQYYLRHQTDQPGESTIIEETDPPLAVEPQSPTSGSSQLTMNSGLNTSVGSHPKLLEDNNPDCANPNTTVYLGGIISKSRRPNQSTDSSFERELAEMAIRDAKQLPKPSTNVDSKKTTNQRKNSEDDSQFKMPLPKSNVRLTRSSTRVSSKQKFNDLSSSNNTSAHSNTLDESSASNSSVPNQKKNVRIVRTRSTKK